jgi:hypothetical protein
MRRTPMWTRLLGMLLIIGLLPVALPGTAAAGRVEPLVNSIR